MTDILLKALAQAIADLPADDATRYYLACSGGRDSLSLAYAYFLLYQQGVIARLPVLLHVNHNWQQANDEWADRVQDWAKLHGFDCQVLQVQLSKNNETHARDARYQAMMSVMNTGDVLILAHHATDQAETVLMRLVNGAGIQGLSAMKMWQQKRLANSSLNRDANPKTIHLWRPWLAMHREVISQFALYHHLPYVDDITNTDTAYARGLIRQKILPHLLALNPKAIENIGRSAQLLAVDFSVIDGQITDHLTNLQHFASCPPYQTILPLQAFFECDAKIQISLLHRWIQGDEPIPPSYSTTSQVYQLIQRTDNDHGSQIIWQGVSASYVICRYDECLYRYRQDVWQLLQGEAMQPQYHQGVWRLIFNDGLCLELASSQIHQLRLMDKDDAMMLAKHRYRAKKLAQKLRLPVWLRRHLWHLQSDNGSYLIAPMMAWELPSGVAVDSFAPIGLMMYNDLKVSYDYLR